MGQKVDTVIRDPARSWGTIYYSGPFQQSCSCCEVFVGSLSQYS